MLTIIVVVESCPYYIDRSIERYDSRYGENGETVKPKGSTAKEANRRDKSIKKNFK